MQETVPLVSVLMTSYNREKYIAEAIESVIGSSYTNWELIIVDDKSIDSTLQIAKKYELKDPRIKVYANERNLGDYVNRNKAASLANGKYLKYLDSDDLILPDGLKCFVLAMERYPNAAFALSLDPKFEITKPLLKVPKEIYQGHFRGYGFLNCGPSGSIIRTSKFNEVNGFSGERYIGDTEMWLKLSQRNCMLLLKPKLIFWREHNDQEYKFEKEDRKCISLRFKLNLYYILHKKAPLNIYFRLKFVINQYKILFTNIIKVAKIDREQGLSLLKLAILNK
jgi:glycosyltransferase involved in cell wall biosynthesis